MTKILYGIFFAAFIALVSWGLAGPRVLDSRDSEIVSQDGFISYRGRLFTGVIVEHYPNGEVFQETNYVRGMKEGVSNEYGLGKRLRVRWNYHRGQKDGTQLAWYLEGPKRFEFNYKDGVLDGLQTEWHLNGGVFRTQNYIKGTEIDKKILFQSGEVFTNYIKRNDRIYGIDGGPLCFEPPREGEKL